MWEQTIQEVITELMQRLNLVYQVRLVLPHKHYHSLPRPSISKISEMLLHRTLSQCILLQQVGLVNHHAQFDNVSYKILAFI